MAGRQTLRRLTVFAVALLVACGAAASGRLAGNGDSESQAVLAAGGTVDAVEATVAAPPVLPPAVPLPTTTSPAPPPRSGPPGPPPGGAVVDIDTHVVDFDAPTGAIGHGHDCASETPGVGAAGNTFFHDIVVTLNGQRFQCPPGGKQARVTWSFPQAPTTSSR